MNVLISVRNLKTYFYTVDGVVPAVDDVSFDLEKGRTLGIVGESGCGKSVTSLSIMRLISNPPGKIIDGQILFLGEDLLSKKESVMRKIRGNEISMIFQEPMTSLNPIFTVGKQIIESIVLHQNMKKKISWDKACEMLHTVGIPSPKDRMNDYPYQLSGGMRQRVMIAMAIACHPKLLIADEPTTALDVTIQAQILGIIRSLKDELGMSMMLITHDLGIVAEMCDEVIVMYAGKIVEKADVNSLFETPSHPYTNGLLASIPGLEKKKDRLDSIKGIVPKPTQMPLGCRFHPRCSYTQKICVDREPSLIQIGNGHFSACWKYTDLCDHSFKEVE